MHRGEGIDKLTSMCYTLGMKRIIALIITVLVAWGVYGYLTYTPVEPEVEAVTYTKYELGPPDSTEMLELVNIEREKAGVPPLAYDANVEKSAQLKADDFAQRDYYSHIVKGTEYTLNEEMAYYVHLSCSSSSENISADKFTSKAAVASWMRSPPHRAAILSPDYQSTGFGVSKDVDGDYYSVQHFCVAL